MEGNTKRIAKNTLFLYFRMLIIMGVSLYTVRIVLNILGVVDYGIYNVVGGVVTMFTFLSGTLASSSQRFFSYEIGRNNFTRLREIFSLNITIFLVLIVIVIILAETVGLWFVNTQLTIPQDRMAAANWIYQFSLLSFVMTVLAVPYNALIIAHEKMSVYAYISILEALLKLAIVFILSIITFDKLKLYAILIFLVSALITLSYRAYCRIKFKESHYFFFWDKVRAKELAGYSGWHFLGSMSMVIRGQGINILLNMFFNPVVNAARSIAYQVNSSVDIFSSNFFTAVKPQIYKLYSSGEIKQMNNLVMQSSKYCFYLMLILSMPFLLETHYILNLWLKSLPKDVVLFTQLVVINALIDSLSGPTIAAALATGKIKLFQQVVSIVLLLNLPISYLFLKLGYSAYITMIVSIVISLISIFVRIILLKKMINLSIKLYLKDVLMLIVIVSTLSFILPIIIHQFLFEGILRFFLVSLTGLLSILIVVSYIGLTKLERQFIIDIVRLKIKL